MAEMENLLQLPLHVVDIVKEYVEIEMRRLDTIAK